MPKYKIFKLATGETVKGPATYYANDLHDFSRIAKKEFERLNAGELRLEDCGSYYRSPQKWKFVCDCIMEDIPEFNDLGEISP